MSTAHPVPRGLHLFVTSRLMRPTDPAHVVVLENPAGKNLLTHLTYHTLEAAGVTGRDTMVVVRAASREEYMERVRREYGEVVDREEMEEQEWVSRCRSESSKQKIKELKEKQDMKSKSSHNDGKAEKKKKEESRIEKRKEAMLAKLKKNKAKLEKDKAAEMEENKAKEAQYDVDKVLLDIEGHGKDDGKTKKSKKKKEDPVLAGEEEIKSVQVKVKGSKSSSEEGKEKRAQENER